MASFESAIATGLVTDEDIRKSNSPLADAKASRFVSNMSSQLYSYRSTRGMYYDSLAFSIPYCVPVSIKKEAESMLVEIIERSSRKCDVKRKKAKRKIAALNAVRTKKAKDSVIW